MGWESFGVVEFDLGPLLQGQTSIAKLKSAYNSLIKRPAKGRLFVYGRPSGSAGSAFCFPYNSVTVSKTVLDRAISTNF